MSLDRLVKKVKRTSLNNTAGYRSTDAIVPRWYIIIMMMDTNLGKKFLRRIAAKRSTAEEKFVEDNAHTPPVHRLAVSLKGGS